MVTEASDPSNGQLCIRNPLTLSDLGETFNDFEVVLESLGKV